MEKKETVDKLVCTNRRASFDYFLSDFLEVGLELRGTEIKSLRQGHGSLTESYISFERGEAFILGFNISEYREGNIFNHDPVRPRKLLMHRLEILRFRQAVEQKGFTCVATKCYLKKGKAKLCIALAKGKNTYDKRDTLKKRELQKDIDKAFKYNNQ